MKRMLIVLASFVFITSLCLYCRNLIQTVNTDMQECLKSIEEAVKTENRALCIKLTDKLIVQANKAGERLGRFYPHIYGENLKENCRQIKHCIEKEQWLLVDEPIAECRYVLQTIILQEQIKWENVF